MGTTYVKGCGTLQNKRHYINSTHIQNRSYVDVWLWSTYLVGPVCHDGHINFYTYSRYIYFVSTRWQVYVLTGHVIVREAGQVLFWFGNENVWLFCGTVFLPQQTSVWLRVLDLFPRPTCVREPTGTGPILKGNVCAIARTLHTYLYARDRHWHECSWPNATSGASTCVDNARQVGNRRSVDLRDQHPAWRSCNHQWLLGSRRWREHAGPRLGQHVACWLWWCAVDGDTSWWPLSDHGKLSP